MPANTFDFRAFMRFLFATGEDRRFTPRDILRQIEVIRQARGIRMICRSSIVWCLRFYAHLLHARTLADAARPFELHRGSSRSGVPGESTRFNPLKAYFNFPPDKLAQEELIGTTDFPSIWNQGQRETLKMNLHWDGNNVSLEERNRSAAMGTGITPPTGDRANLKRVADWLRNLAAPPYPFNIDKDLAAQGRARIQKILRRLSRRRRQGLPRRIRRQSSADRRDRYGPSPPRLLHLRRRGESKSYLRRLRRGAL